MIKIVGIDCDDTLLNSNKEISDYNAKVIREVSMDNVKCVLTTGRPFVKKTIEYYQKMGIYSPNEYYIAYNGAAIYEVYSKKVIYKNELNFNDIIEIHSELKEYDVSHYIHKNGCVCYDVINEYTYLEKKFNDIELYKIDFDNLNQDEKAFKYMISSDPIVIKDIYSKVPKFLKDKYNVVISMPCFLEFMKKDVDKWQGLKKLGEYLNISENEIMAIGDSLNDYQMIKNSKIGVAMENSIPEIIEISDIVTESNDSDGVGKVLKRIFNK